MLVCTYVISHPSNANRCPKGSEEDVRLPGIVFTINRKLSDVGPGE